MAILILDPALEPQVRAVYENDSDPRPTEVWEGVTVVPPMPNTEHNRLVSRLNSALSAVIDWDAGDQCAPGANVSDRHTGWQHNYRNPDVLVYLHGNPAVDHGTHWTGGPDLAVEILSEGEDPRAKFDFYVAVGTRELWVIDRDPWAVEVYRLTSGGFALVGRSDATTSAAVPSSVLPLAARLDPLAVPRPRVLVTHAGTGQTWTA